MAEGTVPHFTMYHVGAGVRVEDGDWKNMVRLSYQNSLLFRIYSIRLYKKQKNTLKLGKKSPLSSVRILRTVTD